MAKFNLYRSLLLPLSLIYMYILYIIYTVYIRSSHAYNLLIYIQHRDFLPQKAFTTNPAKGVCETAPAGFFLPKIILMWYKNNDPY